MFEGMDNFLWMDKGASISSISMMYAAGLSLVLLKIGAISLSIAGVGFMACSRQGS